MPGWRAWQDYVDALETSAGGPVPARPDPTPAQAMARWPLLTQSELDVLCAPGVPPPAGAVGFDSGGGPV